MPIMFQPFLILKLNFIFGYIFKCMGFIKNITAILLFSLLVLGKLFAFPVDDGSAKDDLSTPLEEPIPSQELRSPLSSYLFAIPTDNTTHSITEIHRLGALLRLSNQIIPFNYNFTGSGNYTAGNLYSSPVPIFIRGHALLN